MLSDYGTSMQNLSDKNLTMCGGNSIIFGCHPIRSSSSRCGSHQRLNVLILTPALLASSCFDIAFILNLRFNMTFVSTRQSSCKHGSVLAAPKVHLSYFLLLTSYILHLTSYIIHLTLSYSPVGFMILRTRRNVVFSVLTVHVCVSVRKVLAHLAELATG